VHIRGWAGGQTEPHDKEPHHAHALDQFRELDRLTEQLASTAARAPRAFPMDAYRRGDRFIVEFDLPGVEPASIELTVEPLSASGAEASPAAQPVSTAGHAVPSGEG